MPKTLEFLAEQLKIRRKKLRITQEVFAEKTGISLTLVRDIERKKANPTLATLDKIANFFSITSAELIDTNELINNAEHMKRLIYDDIEQLSPKQLRVMLSLIRISKR
jgi:transcriptional regulator with XRE-family HTH domain